MLDSGEIKVSSGSSAASRDDGVQTRLKKFT